ncbi:DUF998 domain-containing protein [Dactylosporangium sp. CA-052675]|uniref:DUF998 domain-containing protein n=1 Tax=Dactylosporangium sp. CA-052675 TaxID=3239927 RepID=UPI003D9398C6
MTGIQTLVAAATPARPPHRPNRLLRAGLIAGPVFVATVLAQQTFRDGDDPMRHPVTALALGPGGWVRVTGFAIAGLLGLAFALGLRRALRPGPGAFAGPLLVAVWSVGLIGAGLFPADAVDGHPAGALAFWLPARIALAAAMFVLAHADARRHRPAWASCSLVSGIVFAALVVLTSTGSAPHPWLAGAGWLWAALIAAREMRAAPAGPR